MEVEMDQRQEHNRRLWVELYSPPTSATKDFNTGKFRGTDINPQWRLQRLTEVFGPIGQGFGWNVLEHWSETHKQAKWWDGKKTGEEEVKTVYVMLEGWYVENGNRHSTSVQIGGTSIIGGVGADDSYKAAITDALGKCFAGVGLAARVYLGDWDTKVEMEREAREMAEAKRKQAEGMAERDRVGDAPPATEPPYGGEPTPPPPAHTSEPIGEVFKQLLAEVKAGRAQSAWESLSDTQRTEIGANKSWLDGLTEARKQAAGGGL